MRTHIWFCPEPTQAVEYVREARPTLFFGVPRVWEKVRAGIDAKLAAEENERKRKIAERLETGREVVRRTQRGEPVPFGLRPGTPCSSGWCWPRFARRSGWTAAASPPARPRPWPWTWPSTSPPSACPWSRCTA